MRSLITLAAILLFTLTGRAQDIPKKANTIIVHDVSFIDVCNALLDSGYSIYNKDNDLQTVRTEKRDYPHSWNANYVINIRVKDSVAYISGTFTAPPTGELFRNERIYNNAGKDGVTKPKSLTGVPFICLNQFALSFNKPVEYLIR